MCAPHGCVLPLMYFFIYFPQTIIIIIISVFAFVVSRIKLAFRGSVVVVVDTYGASAYFVVTVLGRFSDGTGSIKSN